MSDEREICIREYDRRLFYANLKLGTHQTFESKNSLSALAILYPCYYNGTKLSEKFCTGLYLFAGSVNHEGQRTELHR